jgi:hypothetical protein
VIPPWEKVVVTGVHNGELEMRKPDRSGETESSNGKAAMPDEEFAAEYPTITEYLTTTSWDDGTARKPSTISLFVEQGVVKLALNDRAYERTLFVSGESLRSALVTMDAALAAASIPWVAWKGKRKSL